METPRTHRASLLEKSLIKKKKKVRTSYLSPCVSSFYFSLNICTTILFYETTINSSISYKHLNRVLRTRFFFFFRLLRMFCDENKKKIVNYLCNTQDGASFRLLLGACVNEQKNLIATQRLALVKIKKEQQIEYAVQIFHRNAITRMVTKKS